MRRYPELKLLIDGAWRDGSGSEPVLNPSDESVIAPLPHADQAMLDEAVAAAAEGFRVWRRTAPAKREQIILRAARLLKERAEAIAYGMALDQGKPVTQGLGEVQIACERIEWDATEGRRLYGRLVPAEPGMRHLVVREPLGVVAAFTPWNYPLASPTRKVAGALSAGCSIILKGAEETPSGAVQLCAAFHDAGVPPGVVNLVFGVPAEISEHLIPQPDVRLVTFTGSVPVGKHLAALAGRHMKPAIMELGGSSPVIVCEDADPHRAGIASAVAKARNSGQVCVSPTRFFVHDRIYDAFLEAFVGRAAELRLGDVLDPATEMGPLANRRRLDAMETLIADGVERGARLHLGGKRVGNRGYFYPMTMLSEVPADARLMREEPFGPVALINRVGSTEEAIARANALPYALSAYGFTGSARNVEAMIDGVECGTLSINHFRASFAEAPFGGAKDSGYGREGGTEGLEFYTYARHVSHLIQEPGA
ncbi:MAG TPA: NAD-dependent succinate-semialdehyde dehydrogenase [Stellaceae bacterium]|nr:NAD-dependent succinate-semialdehyde dehydrogenase [Stellaceae bacterium]